MPLQPLAVLDCADKIFCCFHSYPQQPLFAKHAKTCNSILNHFCSSWSASTVSARKS